MEMFKARPDGLEEHCPRFNVTFPRCLVPSLCVTKSCRGATLCEPGKRHGLAPLGLRTAGNSKFRTTEFQTWGFLLPWRVGAGRGLPPLAQAMGVPFVFSTAAPRTKGQSRLLTSEEHKRTCWGIPSTARKCTRIGYKVRVPLRSVRLVLRAASEGRNVAQLVPCFLSSPLSEFVQTGSFKAPEKGLRVL